MQKGEKIQDTGLIFKKLKINEAIHGITGPIVLALSGRYLKWFWRQQDSRFWDMVGIHRLAPAGTAEFEGTLQTQGCWGP